MLAARERYESKHAGNFTRIFPSPDPAKQALYEELLRVGRGAEERGGEGEGGVGSRCQGPVR